MNSVVDPSTVLDVLIRACSQDALVLKPAEQQLMWWENQPGFYSILASVFTKHDMDVGVRWLAVLYFKNGVDRYWRRNAPNAICEEEKSMLRQQLISSFNEPVNQIATQLSVLVGKIARLDCPHVWPELIPLLLEAIRDDDLLRQQRAMLTFYHVIKSLASKRLPGDKKVFEELTSNIFTFVFTMWETNKNNFFTALQSRDNFVTNVSLDRCILCLKVLRKLVIFGFSELDKNVSVINFLFLVFQCLDQVLKARPVVATLSEEMLVKRNKLIVLLSKLLLDVQETHSEDFVQFIRPSLELSVVYNFTEQGIGLNFERFSVYSLNLMRGILRCESYRPAKTIEETKNPVTLMAYRIRLEFFTDEVLTGLCRHLILHYFLLTQDDLVCWESDPESFMSEESGDSWKFSIRPCTENLFRTLVKEFHTTLPDVILKMLTEYRGAINPDDLSAVLRKDAVYCAVGKASFELYDLVDFDDLFVNHLLPELQIKHPNYRIIHRRVIWLIGCWIGVKLSNSLRTKLYDCLVPFLDRSQDLVVRIEAALTLKSSIDDFEFNVEQFLPYLEASFGQLFLLLKDVSECETKMTILHVMSFIIQRMQADIRPHAGALIQYLPMLWHASAEYNMLRCAIITTLTKLVQGLGPLCITMFDLLIPVIRLSTDVTQEPHVYLYEDGLELWLNTIHCTPHCTAQLLDLFTNMAPLLELGTESLKICLKIIEAYIILGKKDFFQRFYSSLGACFKNLLKDIKVEGAVMIYKNIELILKVFPEDGATMFDSLLVDIFRSIVSTEDPRSSDGPVMLAMHLVLASRIILHSPQFFWGFVEKLAKQQGQSVSEFLDPFLSNFVEKMEHVTQPDRRKLCSMAMVSLLTTNASAIQNHFDAIVTYCVEVFYDVRRNNSENGIQSDANCFSTTSSDSPSEDEFETDHDKRRHSLLLQDPVCTVNFRDFVLTQLTYLQNQVGQMTFNVLVNSLDSEIYQQLQQFLQ